MTTPAAVISRLRQVSATIAAAESLTGGLLCATLIDVPGASAVVRGGTVAYQREAKQVLGVSVELIERHGTVSPEVAVAMAEAVRRTFGATIGVATTGNAGPDRSEGKPVGLVYVAVCDVAGTDVRQVLLAGDRHDIRLGAVRAALSLVAARLGEDPEGDEG